MHAIGVVAPRAQFCLQDARRVVHGAALQTGEGQYYGVVGIAAAESLVLRASGALVAYQVGIGAAKARGTGCLVGVDHDVVLGGLLHGIEIVVVHGLRVVMVAAGNDVSHVTGLHGVVAVIIHQLVGLLHPSLIVGDAGGSLVMHHELHALGVGIVVEILDIEVGIGRDEVEHIPFPAVGPVFPAHVPSFHQHLREAVLGGEVYILLHAGRVGGVPAIRLGLRPVYLVQLDRGVLVRVIP